MRRFVGECYDCALMVRCDTGGLACYHLVADEAECPGSREAVKPQTFREDADDVLDLVESSCEVIVRPVRAKRRASAVPEIGAVTLDATVNGVVPPHTQCEPHAAFATEDSPDAARKAAIIEMAQQAHAADGMWPTCSFLSYMLGVDYSTVLAAVALFETSDEVYMAEDGRVVVCTARMDVIPPATNSPETPALADDPLYTMLVTEHAALERDVQALQQQLWPKAVRLGRIARALEAYAAVT